MGNVFVSKGEHPRCSSALATSSSAVRLGPTTTIAPVIPRYSRPAMTRIWSEEAKLERWLAVELAALDAWEQRGHASARYRRAISAARATAPTPERVAELERTTNHDVAAFVDAVASDLGPAGRWFHYGLTSSDVLDTALALTVQDAGRLVLAGIDRAWAAVVERAEEHRDTLTIGRTHGVHAEPMTFGLKLAGWAFQLARDRRRVESALEGMRVGKLSGAVGTYSATSPEVERLACESLGLEPAPSSTQILQRDRHAELLSALALVASSLERFALEIRHLARTEVREVEEPFVRGQKGSSAMPHKRNPIVAERICGLARLVRSYAVVGLENVALWHERDISHSSAERVVLPDAFLAVDYMLDRFAWLDRRARRPSGADARESRGDRRALLQPAAAAGPRRLGPRPRHRLSRRAGACNARVGRGSRLSRRSSGATPSSPGAWISTRSSTSDAFTRAHRCRLPATAGYEERGDPCLKRFTLRAARCARSSRWTTSGCCSSRATGSRPSTSSCRRRSRTRVAF